MAYKGYLIKIGNYTFPLSMIKAETYKATNYGQDLDSTRDVDGILHRTALSNTAPKVEFETRNMLDNTQMSSIFANIQANYTNTVEKKASVEVYVPELDRYVTSDMYMADFEPTMYYADATKIQYTSTRMAWISLWSENSMIKVSEAIKKLYIEDSTPIELEVRFKDNAFPTIKGSDVLSEQMTLHESICEEEQLKFGGCNASSFELTVFNLNSGIKGYEIEPVLITNKTEIPLGVFYVETIEKYAGKDYKKLTAYDKMRYFDVDVKDWYDNLTFPISVKNFRDSLCNYVGVEQNDVTLIADNVMLTKELDSSNGINGLSLMKQICEISGVFGRMDRYGKFDYLSLESSMLLPADDLYPANDLYPSAGSGSSKNSFNIPTSLMYEHPLVEDFFTSNIDGVIIVDSDGAQVITENNQNPYYVQDNFVIMGQTHETITTLANALLSKISSISYRPINSSKIKGQPYVECGDFISGEVNGYGFEAYVFQRDLTGIKALRDAYICKGKELLENDMNGVTATLQRLNSSIGKTKVTIEKTEKGLRGEISQSLEESKKYTDESSSATLESANNYAQDAAQGALNAANNNTNEKLKSYYTKEENDNQFDATARGFTAQISSTKEELKKYTDSSASSTLNSANEYAQEAANGAMNAANNNTNEKLKSYYTKEESDLQIKASSDSLSSTISKTQSKWDLVSNDGKKDYRNKKVNYGFGKTTNGSELFVDSDGKYYYLDVSSGIMYQIIKLGESGGETKYGIEEQTQLRTIESHTSSEISQISNEIVLKVDDNGRLATVKLGTDANKGTVVKIGADSINLTAEETINFLSGGEINLSGKNISIKSDNFNVDKGGNMVAKNGKFEGDITSNNATINGGNINIAGDSQDDARINLYYDKYQTVLLPMGLMGKNNGVTKTYFSTVGGMLRLSDQTGNYTNNITHAGISCPTVQAISRLYVGGTYAENSISKITCGTATCYGSGNSSVVLNGVSGGSNCAFFLTNADISISYAHIEGSQIGGNTVYANLDRALNSGQIIKIAWVKFEW